MSQRPSIVALGGGTGLAAALRGLKSRPVELTALVTVSDDGGSSGRLRRELGMPPPGDIRNCLVALADDESLLGRLFQHRFEDGDLSGHSFGNLFLAALTGVTGGFDRAVEECSRVLKIRGRVLPTTLLEEVRVCGEKYDGRTVRGESVLSATPGPCRRVWLEPSDVPAHPPALEAIRTADLIMLGPGSLFTSVLAHLAIADVSAAVHESPAMRVYVCNVMTQPGETEGMDAAWHVERVLESVPGGLDAVLVHEGEIPAAVEAKYRAQGQEPVATEGLERLGVRIVRGPLASVGHAVRHDPELLAAAIHALAREAAARPRKDRGEGKQHLQRT